MDRNKQYAKEFQQDFEKCYPDLVLTVDDISNFFPTGIIDWSVDNKNETEEQKHIKKQYMTSNNNDYAYKNEVVGPIQKLNSRAIFIGTLKKEDPEQLELHITHQQGKETLHFSKQEQPDPSQLLASLKMEQIRMSMPTETEAEAEAEAEAEFKFTEEKPQAEDVVQLALNAMQEQKQNTRPQQNETNELAPLHQKIVALRQECEKYFHHLDRAIAKEDAKTKPNTQAKSLAISKREGIAKMYLALLTNEPMDTQLSNFNILFEQLKPHFELRRDSTEVAFLNKIIKILASTAIYLFGLWKTEGGKTLDRMKAIQEAGPDPTPAKIFQPKPHSK